MTLTEYNELAPVTPTTITDDKTGMPTGLMLPNGTFIAAAPSNVGKTIRTEGQEFIIRWDGGMSCPHGGFTKGQLIKEYRSHDSLHMLREMYAKGSRSDVAGAPESDSSEGPSSQGVESCEENEDGYADLAEAFNGTDD